MNQKGADYIYKNDLSSEMSISSLETESFQLSKKFHWYNGWMNGEWKALKWPFCEDFRRFSLSRGGCSPLSWDIDGVDVNPGIPVNLFAVYSRIHTAVPSLVSFDRNSCRYVIVRSEKKRCVFGVWCAIIIIVLGFVQLFVKVEIFLSFHLSFGNLNGYHIEMIRCHMVRLQVSQRSKAYYYEIHSLFLINQFIQWTNHISPIIHN